MPYTVYILRSRKDGTLYIGQTQDLEGRLKRHNGGLIRSTKSRAPFDLLYVEEYQTRREAMYREWVLKLRSGIQEKRAILKSLGL